MLRDQLRTALKQSLKDGDNIATAALRLVISNLKERDRVQTIEAGKAELSDAEIIGMLQTMLKQRRESIKAYTQGGRPDLVAREETEILVLQRFMPQQLDDSALDSAIDEALALLRQKTPELDKSAIGQVMALLRANHPGTIDMARAANRVKARL